MLAGPLGNPYSSHMSPLRAHVEKGRLVLDEPTTLPRERLLTWVTTKSDDLTDGRRALHEALSASRKCAGSCLRPASGILDDLRQRR